MSQMRMKTLKLLPWAGTFLLAMLEVPWGVAAARSYQNPQQPDSYNSSTPVPPPTPDPADRPKITPSDRAISQKIRRALATDKNLSAEARKINILSQNGKVTLKGSVPSSSERTTIVSKAEQIAGQGNVTDKIEVASPKQ
jgi:hypothetical protein